MNTFRALVATGDGPAQFQDLTDADLPEDAVTVDVSHSGLNYKDGLSVTNKGRIARSFPMICGADLAGTVAASDDPAWAPGDEVLVTGWGLSETHSGGYTERQRVKPEWLIRRPAGLTAVQAMAIGTAGLTSMLCVLALEDHGLTPESGGEVLVTGAAGGVGSIAVSILARLGYRVTASTGRPATHELLKSLGASAFVDRAELAVVPGKPLEKERWSAAIDTVGSTTLASVLRQTRSRGAVAACGLAGGNDLPITVLPFILRNVALLGVDSVQCPPALRTRAWERLSTDLPLDLLDSLTTVEPLGRAPELAEQILAGQVAGRVVFDTRA
ncbi:putative YhdH/YhfP family quinone oxidoreductase [Nakamurella sp. UYEF19]|uniref:MDR family oxidoreductase n=1 Tax=Nakamurella sp. UYEF19 TaxID=1756392 RepID=UPI003390A210